MHITAKIKITSLAMVVALVMAACGGDRNPVPKPRAYMRIDMPEHNYWLVDTIFYHDTTYRFNDSRFGDSIIFTTHEGEYKAFPFAFEANQCAEVSEKDAPKGVSWIDVTYPQWNGVIFLTYKHLRTPADLAGEVDTSYRLISQHFDFASGIDERLFVNEANRVYATTYRLQGQNVASTYQFWATDSVSHFLRGSLYIDCVPNNDSLAPVLQYLQADIDHLLETLRWRDDPLRTKKQH